MRDFKDKNPAVRLQAAAQAKQAMIQRLRSMPEADEKVVAERRIEQQAIATAREVRIAERQAAKARDEAERIASEAAEAAERIARAQREAEEDATRQAALVAEQKAARDARYAARKKGKKG